MSDITDLLTEANYNSEAKKAFHRTAKRLLRRVGRLLEVRYGEYTVRSCLGGIAVPGEAILHMDDVYISVQGGGGLQGDKVLVRSCDGPKDYTGGPNHYISKAMLINPMAFAHGVAKTIPSIRR